MNMATDMQQHTWKKKKNCYLRKTLVSVSICHWFSPMLSTLITCCGVYMPYMIRDDNTDHIYALTK